MRSANVQSRELLIAINVNEQEQHEIIWSELFSYLKGRKLKDIRLVTSDDHKRLVKTVKKHFKESSSWQHYQTHFSRNMLEACI